MRGRFILISTLLVLLLLSRPSLVLAAACSSTVSDGTNTYKDVVTLACLEPIIVNIIDLAFTFLGIVAFLMLIVGATKYVTSGGDPKALQGAQKTMTYAAMGIVVIVLSVVLIKFVTGALGLPDIISQFALTQ